MKRTRALGGLLLVVTTLGLGSTTPGHAGELRCMSDPVVLLSDGTVIDLTASIATELWNVESVNYVLRVPAGSFAVAVLRTPNWPTTVETFSVIADQPAGRYDGTTTVRTADPGVEVQARLLVGTSLVVADGIASQKLRTVVSTNGLLGGLSN
ncbi:MAG TPA: hypothetical protein VFM29_02375 [Vicinamibacteria bacterium]|nr:hypothetical protein [Vicinamibacteria bacterium]